MVEKKLASLLVVKKKLASLLVVNGQLAGFNLIDFTIYYAQTSLVFQRRGPTEPPNNFQAMASTSLPPYVVEGIASQLENKPHHVRYVLGNFFQTAQDCCIEVEPLLACGVQKGILNKMAEVMSIAKMTAKRLEYDDTYDSHCHDQPAPEPPESKTLKEKLEDWGRARI